MMMQIRQATQPGQPCSRQEDGGKEHVEHHQAWQPHRSGSLLGLIFIDNREIDREEDDQKRTDSDRDGPRDLPNGYPVDDRPYVLCLDHRCDSSVFTFQSSITCDGVASNASIMRWTRGESHAFVIVTLSFPRQFNPKKRSKNVEYSRVLPRALFLQT